MAVLVIIQTRLTPSHSPRNVLRALCGLPIPARTVDRMALAKRVIQI